MTPDQIKQLAKQACGTTHTTMGDRLTIFLPDALAEFVRLVRESALEEAAVAVEKLKATSSDWCAEKIRSLKNGSV